MRAFIGLCIALTVVSACVAPEADGAPQSGFDTSSTAPSATTPTVPEPGATPGGADPLTEDEVPAAIAAIERALLILGLEPTVTYDAEAARFSVVAVGNVPFDNAKLAERIIGIVGDPSQPGALALTHSQLRVRIQPDPDSDRQCNCAPQ